ncbi:hypothetical protein [Rhodopirellula sp. P2]|uniref:hypothetical protein n=1 Tax=Rhodopirellula sp. P2 TaxID=2127060 RepID=UPI002368A8AF|nr:hypothetical protein [Rhodopirellula sp. P2]WDQ15909.1 hypothetical protein PSR62_20050 [Rhodopirellula sp. P2]
MIRFLTNVFQPQHAHPLFAAVFVLVGVSTLVSSEAARAQQALPFRPIGSPSAVDQTETARRQRAAQNTVVRPTSFRSPQTAYDPNVRQVAMQSGGFDLPGDIGGPQTFTPPAGSQPVQSQPSFGVPPSVGNSQPGFGNSAPVPSPPSGMSAPAGGAPTQGRSLPAPTAVPNDVLGGNPTFAPNRIGPPPSDYAPVPPPQLSNGGYATMSNCALISAPSEYSAMSPYSGYGYGQGCATPGGVAPVGYIAPPAQIAAPAAIPATAYPVGSTVPPVASTTLNAGPAGALIDFGQGANPVQVGPGLWGQPVAYVPGQGVRNWLRYFSF